MVPVRAAVATAIGVIAVPAGSHAVIGPSALAEPAVSTVVPLIDGEFWNGPRRRRVPFLSWQRRTNQLTICRPRIALAIVVSIGARRFFRRRPFVRSRARLEHDRFRRRHRFDGIGLSSDLDLACICDSWRWRKNRFGGPAPWDLAALEGMFGIARGTPGLPDGIIHDGDDGMVGNASFTWAVVVHEVAKTQRALLHSVLPEKGPSFCAESSWPALCFRRSRSAGSGPR
jgi:hypothetical protein